MKINEIRKTFLDFFAKKAHTIVPSGALVPVGDDTLLFTNAGMVPFKEVFLGKGSRPYLRATSCQRCVRAGGKHNDLEQVGYTGRHLTFFEMLGNFSFGDYFKREAIFFAWEFLTQVLKLPKDRLWITVYTDDDEAAEIWLKEVGISSSQISRCEEDNFWSMGDTGPCGPCSEIFYDHGPEVPGGPPGSPEADGDRYTEIWNLVFMQFNRQTDGSLVPLPKPSVDTGMGLERLAAVLQGVHSSYDTDLFKYLIKEAARIVNTKDLQHHSLKVLADHVRSCAFLMADGVVPSNEGRGYVLRRILRRAIRHGVQLGASTPFFYQLIEPLVHEMGVAYPLLAQKQVYIVTLFKQEEQQFAKTLDLGLKLFNQAIANLNGNILSGELAFKLYDTYGFPVDLTADLAREKGLHLDMAGFETHMQEQRLRARAASQFKSVEAEELWNKSISEFCGYEKLVLDNASVVGLYTNHTVKRLEPGEKGQLILDKTPFYAQGGGQVADQGMIKSKTGVFRVENVKKQENTIIHFGELISGYIEVSSLVSAGVDKKHRKTVAANHSATHLLHAALREVLGESVQQKGSLVAPDRLRFDFSHPQAVGIEALKKVERLVNQQIQKNIKVHTEIMSPDLAQQKGATALFGEKYGDAVRVLTMGNSSKSFSIELCGGTHVKRTGQIGFFKIISEGGLASGVRRIEALTGLAALSYVQEQERFLSQASTALKTDRQQLVPRIESTLEKVRLLEKKVSQLETARKTNIPLDQDPLNMLIAKSEDHAGIKIVIAQVQVDSPKALRELLDNLKAKLVKAVILLASVSEERLFLVAGLTEHCSDRLSAEALLSHIAPIVGGKGGGRKELAQAGGSKPENLDKALEAADLWIKQHI
jgi:alanyl-tRNA synthetase